jgi:hypothetical protein
MRSYLHFPLSWKKPEKHSSHAIDQVMLSFNFTVVPLFADATNPKTDS